MDSDVSTTSSRSDYLRYFQDELGLEPRSARLMLRAERLQEKGEIGQAALYFAEVLRVHPACEEASMNIEMITKTKGATSAAPNSPQSQPDSRSPMDRWLCESIRRQPNQSTVENEHPGLVLRLLGQARLIRGAERAGAQALSLPRVVKEEEKNWPPPWIYSAARQHWRNSHFGRGPQDNFEECMAIIEYEHSY